MRILPSATLLVGQYASDRASAASTREAHMGNRLGHITTLVANGGKFG
jgi:hypothetical protein